MFLVEYWCGGIEEFLTTDWLLHSSFAGPLIGTLNIRNSYCNASIISVTFLRAMNSDPKLDDSTIFCLWEYHMIRVFWTSNIIPVCDL